jgi:hypothetical protein
MMQPLALQSPGGTTVSSLFGAIPFCHIRRASFCRSVAFHSVALKAIDIKLVGNYSNFVPMVKAPIVDL